MEGAAAGVAANLHPGFRVARYAARVLHSLLIAACSAPAASAVGSTHPLAYDQTPPVGGPPAITPASAEAALDVVFATVFAYNGDVLFRAYHEAMAYADAECPPIASGDGGSMWDTNCVSNTGAEFDGFISEFEGTQDENEARRMRGEASISLPDGTELVVAGEVSTDVVLSAEHPAWRSEMSGVMRYDGPAAAGTWIAQESDVNLSYELLATAGDTLERFLINGSVAGLDGDITAVAFAQLQMDTVSGAQCALEPAGEIRLRDTDGVWASLTFDASFDEETGWSAPEGTCDGCAELMYDGESLGPVCVDFAVLLQSELPPW